jgi:hypothetical protein
MILYSGSSAKVEAELDRLRPYLHFGAQAKKRALQLMEENEKSLSERKSSQETKDLPM